MFVPVPRNQGDQAREEQILADVAAVVRKGSGHMWMQGEYCYDHGRHGIWG